MGFNWSSFAKILGGLIETPSAGAESDQINVSSTVQGGGYNLGNQGMWSITKAFLSQNFWARRGITQVYSGAQNKHAIGDTAGAYIYTFSDGGLAASSDEGMSGITVQAIENQGNFLGTVSSTTGTGDTAPVLAFTSGNKWTTDGGYLLDITKGQLAGLLTAPTSVVSLTTNSGTATTFLNSLPVGTITVTASAYNGATTYSTGQIVSSGGSNYVSLVNGNVGNTPASSPTQWAVLAANHIPVSTAIGIATAAIAPGFTTRDVPVAVTLTVNLAQIGGIYKLFTNGSVVSVAGNEYPEQSIVSSASGLLAGNQQTFTIHVCNPNAQAIIFQGGIQGNYISSDANLAFSGMMSAYFAFGSLTGTDMIYGNQVLGGVTNNHLPNAGCEYWQASGANSAWHLYPGAEVVKNTNQGFACVVEQNGVAWANTDVVRCTHFPTVGGQTAFIVRNQYSPPNAGAGWNGMQIALTGTGICGGNSSAILVVNALAGSNYLGDSGPLQAPGGLSLSGQYSNPIYISNAPDISATNAVIFVQNPNTANSDLTAVIQLNWNAAGNFTFTTSTGRWTVTGAFNAQNGFLTNGVAGITHVSPLAKLTPGGTNGSITFSGGLATAFVDPT